MLGSGTESGSETSQAEQDCVGTSPSFCEENPSACRCRGASSGRSLRVGRGGAGGGGADPQWPARGLLGQQPTISSGSLQRWFRFLQDFQHVCRGPRHHHYHLVRVAGVVWGVTRKDLAVVEYAPRETWLSLWDIRSAVKPKHSLTGKVGLQGKHGRFCHRGLLEDIVPLPSGHSRCH